jgi:hypothetical protein
LNIALTEQQENINQKKGSGLFRNGKEPKNGRPQFAEAHTSFALSVIC